MSTSTTEIITQLTAIHRAPNTSTVGELFLIHERIQFDEKQPISTSNEMMQYSKHAYYLLQQEGIPTDATLKSLILDEDQYIEAEQTERKLHHAVNFATIYAEAT